MKSNRLQEIEFETAFGTKSVELWHGDLTSDGFASDLLVISAFEQDYTPSSNSVIGALTRGVGIDVSSLAHDAEIDLRRDLGVWVSRETGTHFKRIVCLESGRKDENWNVNFKGRLENLFGALALMTIKGLETRTITMTILGTGDQNLSLAQIIPTLINVVRASLASISQIKQVTLVDRSLEKVSSASKLFDETLGRTSIDSEPMRRDATLEKLLDQAVKIAAGLFNTALSDDDKRALARLIDCLKKDDASFIHAARESRHSLEHYLTSLTGGKVTVEEGINKLAKKGGAAPWVISNMKTIQAFGNYASHPNTNSQYKPKSISSGDRLLLMHALIRFLDHWATI